MVTNEIEPVKSGHSGALKLSKLDLNYRANKYSDAECATYPWNTVNGNGDMKLTSRYSRLRNGDMSKLRALMEMLLLCSFSIEPMS